MRDYCWFEKSLGKYLLFVKIQYGVSEWMWPFPIFRGGRGAKNIKSQKSRTGIIKSSADSVTRELDVLRFPSVKEEIVPSTSRKVKQKRYSSEETKIDKECDFVIVPFDGECVSDTESVDSDWSIGWLEPHGTGFSSHDDESCETDNNFAVLVPCYGCNYGGMLEDNPKNNVLSNAGYFSDGKRSLL
jgi:hypothetical protein